jgi:hypothetical protein
MVQRKCTYGTRFFSRISLMTRRTVNRHVRELRSLYRSRVSPCTSRAEAGLWHVILVTDQIRYGNWKSNDRDVGDSGERDLGQQ